MIKDCEKLFVLPEQSIREALSIIDSAAMRIALVVDSQRILLGVVTDGDVRRALLKDISLDDKVTDVMNDSPTVAEYGTAVEKLISIMESKKLLAIPLLKDGAVVAIQTLEEAVSKPHFSNPVFLMAGGFGTRLRPLTDNCPKPLLKVGGTPILETTLLRFIKFGFRNFYISTHYMPEMIQEHFGDGSQWGVNIQYVHEESPLGTGGALGLLPKDMPDLPIIMMNGDLLTKIDFVNLLNFHDKHQAIATMAVRQYDYQIPYGVIEGENSRITSIVEKPTQRFFVNAGIYVVSQALAKSVKENSNIDMPTLLEQQMHDDKDVMMFPIHEYWLDIGQKDDFDQAQLDIHTLDLY